MTGMIHAGSSVREADSFDVCFFCHVSDLKGAIFTEVLDLAGDECGVEEEELCFESRAVRLVPAGRALSRYL